MSLSAQKNSKKNAWSATVTQVACLSCHQLIKSDALLFASPSSELGLSVDEMPPQLRRNETLPLGLWSVSPGSLLRLVNLDSGDYCALPPALNAWFKYYLSASFSRWVVLVKYEKCEVCSRLASEVIGKGKETRSKPSA